MIDIPVLFHAKSFLCWDKYSDLSIKLIPIQNAVSFFYPPQKKLSTIVLFYLPKTKNIIETLCFLFHEVGHYLQWNFPKSAKTKYEFNILSNLDKGEPKIKFELEAWNRGKKVLIEFLQQEKVDQLYVLKKFDKLTEASLQTYCD